MKLCFKRYAKDGSTRAVLVDTELCAYSTNYFEHFDTSYLVVFTTAKKQEEIIKECRFLGYARWE